MIDFQADNQRLRKWMKRIISEREIASAALWSIAIDADNAGQVARAAIDKMRALPMPDETPEQAAVRAANTAEGAA